MLYQRMRKNTYSKELAKLENRSSPDISIGESGTKKATFRRSMYQEELSNRPQIGKNTHKYLMKRHKSTGNICEDLYQDSFVRNKRKTSTEKDK